MNLIETMKNKGIKEEDFDFYSSLGYLLFITRSQLSSNQRQLILKNLPLKIINHFFVNNQINNDNNPLFNFSSYPSPSIPFPGKNINTLLMIINIIILCNQIDEDMKIFIEYYGKEEIYFFNDNMCYLLETSNNFRLNRKILGLLANFFVHSDEIILKYMRNIERIINEGDIRTNIIAKLQQIVRIKQKNYINLIVGNKTEIEEKIKKNDIVTIDNICDIFKFLIFILSGS